MKISSTSVTPELEKEFQRKFYEYIKVKETYYSSLPSDQRQKEIAKTSIASAITAMTTTTTTTQPSQAFTGSEGEGCDSVTVIPSTSPIKSRGFGDIGEGM